MLDFVILEVLFLLTAVRMIWHLFYAAKIRHRISAALCALVIGLAIAAVSLENDHDLPVAIGPAHLAHWWSADRSAEQPATVGGGEDLVLLARARGDRAVMLSHRNPVSDRTTTIALSSKFVAP